MRPPYIQPYYREWKRCNPHEPAAWEKGWKNNLHFMTWMKRMHQEFKKEILERNSEDTFDWNKPYNKEELKKFEEWLSKKK